MKSSISIVLQLTVLFSFGQSKARDIEFIESLFKSNDYKSAILYIDSELKDKKNDSVQFLKAWAYYNIDQQDSAIKNFESISNQQNDLFIKSRFFLSASAYLGKKVELSDSVLNTTYMLPLDSSQRELLAIQNAGVSLLKRDLPAYLQHKKTFSYNNYLFSNEEKQLESIAKTLASHKKKRPLVAALLSAILPGSGKWYAGSRGQAFSSFFSFLLPAAVATEAYLKAGPKSGLFISSALVTTMFYSGSIVGSAYTAKRAELNFNNGINEKILFNIHFPLRNFYSK